MSRFSPYASFVLLSLLGACGSSTSSSPVPTPTSIIGVQDGTVSTGTLVVLSNVVITAIAQDDHTLWVADALAGAQWNGIKVIRPAGDPALGAEFVVGAVVQVAGKVSSASGGGAVRIRSISGGAKLTYVSAPTGSPAPLTAVSIDALTTDPVAGGAANAQVYEGTLVQVANVMVTSGPDASGIRDFASGAAQFVSDDDIYQLGDITGTCYASLVGIWSYSVSRHAWAILPVSAAGAVGGGTCS